MDIVSRASRPRRLRFLRLSSGSVQVETSSHDHESSLVSGKTFTSTNNMWSGSRYISDKDAMLMFDTYQAAQYMEYLEYTIGLGNSGKDNNMSEKSL